MDAIRLKNMQFFAYHGANEHENELGQKFAVDVEMRGSLKVAALSDELGDTFDYNEIYKIVSETVTGSRLKLIESLAEEICRKILHVYPRAQVKITVRKPNIPVAGVLDYAEVEVVRGPVQDHSTRQDNKTKVD